MSTSPEDLLGVRTVEDHEVPKESGAQLLRRQSRINSRHILSLRQTSPLHRLGIEDSVAVEVLSDELAR